ncbi:MAG TPA: hypothetical protein VGJ81_10290 [Thermoanaerobaculia bacterium]
MPRRTVEKVFDEIQVFDGVAERTGVTVDCAAVRGNHAMCRSVTELTAKSRRLGDGYYYLAANAWPADTKSVSLTRAWVSLES